MIEIEVFADIVCPFAHVGLQRWVGRRRQFGRDDVRLRLRAWPLELVNGAPMDPAAVAHKVADLQRQVAPELFGGFDAACFPKTSLPALALTHAAYRTGIVAGETVGLRLRSLLFDEGVDISRADVLAQVADHYGLHPDDSDAAAVLEDHRDGVARGVVGSPHFFLPDGTDAFCPTLDISRRDDGLAISFDRERFDALTEAMFA